LFLLGPAEWALTDAIRASTCVGGVVAIGWWAGDIEARLTASSALSPLSLAPGGVTPNVLANSP
jgi:hypothetical protein